MEVTVKFKRFSTLFLFSTLLLTAIVGPVNTANASQNTYKISLQIPAFVKSAAHWFKDNWAYAVPTFLIVGGIAAFIWNKQKNARHHTSGATGASSYFDF